MENTTTYALITGASQGFGKELAEELARRKVNLLLVALPDEGLGDLCKDLTARYNILAHCLEIDLTKEHAVYDVARWATTNYKVNILINNAGIGGSRSFEMASVEMLESMISINVRVVTLLTRLMLSELKSHKKAYILNVASMASFSPIAFKTIYPASKAFVYSFSRGLHQELKGTGISVSVIHPGPMKTNPEVTSRIEGQSFIARLGLVSPKKVARIAIDGLLQKQTQIVPGLYNKFFWLLMKIIPLTLRLNMVSDIMKNEADTGVIKRRPMRLNE